MSDTQPTPDQMVWRPIDSAPTDEPVLMFSNYTDWHCIEVAEVNQYQGTRYKVLADGSMVKLEATHWMPLPEPPNE